MKTTSKAPLIIELKPVETEVINGGKHGADDPPGDDRGGHGADDPAGHH